MFLPIWRLSCKKVLKVWKMRYSVKIGMFDAILAEYCMLYMQIFKSAVWFFLNIGAACCAYSVICHICRIYLSMIKKTLSYDIIFEANHYICMRYQLNVKSMQDLNRLKVVLVEQKKTGKWLAEQLGKDPSTISKWCSNKIQPSLEMLSQIAKTLNVDTKELIN